MMSYTFSLREKVLLVILALILVGLAWFMFVYQGSANEVIRLNGQIADTESEIAVATGRVSQLAQMQQDIEKFKESGARQVEVPAYDNLQPLMIELNSVMEMTNTYSLSFDELKNDVGFVERGAQITYSCNSYEEVEAVMNAMVNGPYPCSIDSASIGSASSGGSRTATSGAVVTASIHVTFYEKE